MPQKGQIQQHEWKISIGNVSMCRHCTAVRILSLTKKIPLYSEDGKKMFTKVSPNCIPRTINAPSCDKVE